MNNLPEFTRVVWVSKVAEKKWSPIFKSLSAEAARIEYQTVKQGLRKLAIVSFTPQDFNMLSLPAWLNIKVLDVHTQPKQFMSETCPPVRGEPFMLRTVIGRKDDTQNFLRYWAVNDQGTIGHLLGYPTCCVKFFLKHWVEKEEKDFTWQQMNVKNGLHRAVVSPDILLNPMYQKLGIRAIYHMPCSINCSNSKGLAEIYLKLWDPNLERYLIEILSWPVEWSALHGASEIRTPVCKIVTDTNPTSFEFVVQFAGSRVPAEAEKGNRFPYNHSIDTYSNNGFTSEKAMNRGHNIILKAARQAKNVKGIFDPGCGNGRLLHELVKIHPNAKARGIEFNRHAIAQGGRCYPELKLIQGDLFLDDCSADMVVLMPGRLTENPDHTKHFVDNLKFRYLLLYGYNDYAHVVWNLKEKHWPHLKVCSAVVDDMGVATLLERA